MTMRKLLDQLRCFDHSEAEAEASGRHGQAGFGSVPEAIWVAAVHLWRQRLFLSFSEAPSPEKAFEDLCATGATSMGLHDWQTRLQAMGLTNDADEAAASFGILVSFKHSRWMPRQHGNDRKPATVGPNDLARALRLAAPLPAQGLALRHLRERLLEEFGGLSKAFEHIAGSAKEEVTLEAWLRGLLQGLWITQAEALKCWVLFDLTSDGNLTQAAFTKSLNRAEAVSKLQGLCGQLVQRHNIVSRGFEGMPLAVALELRDFEATISNIFSLTPTDAHLISVHVQPDLEATLQLADLLDTLTSIEDRHHRHLLHIHMPTEEDVEKAVGEVESRRLSMLPKLPRLHVQPSLGGVAEETSAVVATDSIVQLPRINQQQPAQKDRHVAFEAVAVAVAGHQPLRETPRETDAERIRRTRQWAMKFHKSGIALDEEHAKKEQDIGKLKIDVGGRLDHDKQVDSPKHPPDSPKQPTDMPKHLADPPKPATGSKPAPGSPDSPKRPSGSPDTPKRLSASPDTPKRLSNSPGTPKRFTAPGSPKRGPASPTSPRQSAGTSTWPSNSPQLKTAGQLMISGSTRPAGGAPEAKGEATTEAKAASASPSEVD